MKRQWKLILRWQLAVRKLRLATTIESLGRFLYRRSNELGALKFNNENQLEKPFRDRRALAQLAEGFCLFLCSVIQTYANGRFSSS